MKRRLTNSGFTLIELLVSFSILLIVSAGTLQAIQAANILSIEAKETTIAIADARAVLERIKITGLGSLPVNGAQNAAALWPNLNTFVSMALPNEQITVEGGSGNQVRQIIVRISWTGPRNKARQIQFTTMKSLFNG